MKEPSEIKKKKTDTAARRPCIRLSVHAPTVPFFLGAAYGRHGPAGSIPHFCSLYRLCDDGDISVWKGIRCTKTGFISSVTIEYI